jgi:hypothetical protein
MTSHFLQYAGWAIKNGASAVHGSYVEPFALQVNSGGNFASNLLKGNQVATSAVFGMSSSPKNIEVWGDGLAAPYYYESTEEEDTMKYKSRILPTSPRKNSSVVSYVSDSTIGNYGFGAQAYMYNSGIGAQGNIYMSIHRGPPSPVVGTAYFIQIAIINAPNQQYAYTAVTGDTQEDVVDGIIATYNSALNTNERNSTLLTKVFGPSEGSYSGQAGIRMTGVDLYSSTYFPVISSFSHSSMLQDPNNWFGNGAFPKTSLSGADVIATYFDQTDNPILQTQFISLAFADRASFVDNTTGWPASGNTFFLILTGKDATETAEYISLLNGEDVKVEKITFRNIENPNVNDIVILREDLNPWVDQYSFYLCATLNATNGTAYRDLPFEDGVAYESTIEFSSKDLGFPSGANKSIISRSVISHNTES